MPADSLGSIDPHRAPTSDWPGWRCLLTGLIALALGLSSYLGWHFLAGGSVLGCGGGSPCDEVLNSRWSSIGGVVPVSGLAAGAYLALLIASFYLGPTTELSLRRLAWRAFLVLAGAAAGSAIWFTMVQKWILGSFCPYCLATHLTGLVLAVLVLWQAPRQYENTPGSRPATDGNRVIRTGALLGYAVLGLSLAGILAVAQWKIAPRTQSLRGEAQPASASALDPHTGPVIGPGDAHYIVALLFDYNCPHCQKLHFMLDEAVRRYHGQLAFALCPTPLNSHCNPYIPQDIDEFATSCQLARLGLAVWAADRHAFPVFDNWMFSLDSGDQWKGRAPEAARAKAIELLGAAKLAAAERDPWIDQYLQTSLGVYHGTLQGGNAVPKMVYGAHWVIAQPADADGLMTILQNDLGVPPP